MNNLYYQVMNEMVASVIIYQRCGLYEFLFALSVPTFVFSTR